MEAAELRSFARGVRDDPRVRGVVSLVALVIVIAAGLVALNSTGYISFAFIASHWQFLLNPAGVALFATVTSFLIGFFCAIPLGLVRAFGPNSMKQRGRRSLLIAPLYGFATGYAEAIRGTPVFVQILLIEGLVTAAAPKFPSVNLWAGIIALAINTAGYQSEVFRAGFQSVGQGQIEAAKSVGMTGTQVFTNITLPQALRLMTLPLANEWIGLFKASALLWVISVQELMWATDFLGSNLNHPIDAFILGSFFYLAIIIPLSRTITYLERKNRIPGLGITEPQRTRFTGIRRVAVAKT